mmetsp:Transcript_468/g.587  ORF Transcript_468/g.587 Transcript_468/m.587 type:complete len:243 (-) Transcript_468:66-794(-)
MSHSAHSAGSGASDTSAVVIRVAVGSGNPCKIDAVRSAFEETFSSSPVAVDVVVTSHNVESGVSNQPIGDDETKLGAMNRARAAWALAEKEGCQTPDFAVGLEGGVEEGAEFPNGSGVGGVNILWCMAWMAVLGSDSEKCTLARTDGTDFAPKKYDSGEPQREVWGFGRTGSFALPPKVARLVNEGVELGEADDIVFKRTNSGQGQGTVGKLTRGMIDRSNYYDHSLKLALVPWIRPELYIE